MPHGAEPNEDEPNGNLKVRAKPNGKQRVDAKPKTVKTRTKGTRVGNKPTLTKEGKVARPRSTTPPSDSAKEECTLGPQAHGQDPDPEAPTSPQAEQARAWGAHQLEFLLGPGPEVETGGRSVLVHGGSEQDR